MSERIEPGPRPHPNIYHLKDSLFFKRTGDEILIMVGNFRIEATMDEFRRMLIELGMNRELLIPEILNAFGGKLALNGEILTGDAARKVLREMPDGDFESLIEDFNFLLLIEKGKQ